MHRAAFVLALLPLLSAASAPVQQAGQPIDLQLRQARAEAAAADARARRLERAAAAAQNEAGRLRAEQLAAAEAIAAAEARITAADAELRLLAATLATRRQRLEREQRPAALLLAGLAMMAERPPLLAIADDGSTEEFVRVKLLLDSTLPVIRERTAALSAELEQGRKLATAARRARDRLAASRDELAGRRNAFAELEARALRFAERSGAEALAAGDVAIAAGETAEDLAGEQAGSRPARAFAAELAGAEPAPARPGAAAGQPARAPFPYRLPAAAPVVEGLGAVSSSGVRSRGLRLATNRGDALAAPASGIVRFAGPFRSHDGIVIIDHGQGWMSLLVNVASPLRRGSRVELGAGLGRALGPIGVELSHNGQRVSPALIAGSSRSLSKSGKDG